MIFTVDNLGAGTYHSKSFSHKLTGGFPFWVILNTETPHLINQGDEIVLAKPGSCIIYPPNYPRYLYCPPDQDGVTNNWVHFSVSDDTAFRQLLSELSLPINQIFMLKATMPVVATLQDISFERFTDRPHSDRMVTALMHVLLLHLSRSVTPVDRVTDYRMMQHSNNFEQLRKQVYTYPEREWDVPGMASSVFLGQNQFIILYRSFFGVTPKQDIVNARMVKAKSLLGNSYILQDVALACGFKNEFYFSTVFKKVVGVTPGQYAKAHNTVLTKARK